MEYLDRASVDLYTVRLSLTELTHIAQSLLHCDHAVLARQFEMLPTDAVTDTPPHSTSDLLPLLMELVDIPACSFPMDVDGREHLIQLGAYSVGKYPVTNGQYKQFIDSTAHRAPKHWKDRCPPAGKLDHPVTSVSYDDAEAYCKWLTSLTGKHYSLPTEAQWKRAAAGPEKREYPWGNTPPCEHLCNYNNNVGDTTPVDRYPSGATPEGCMDMAGNVWEACQGIRDGQPVCVWRGGSWSNYDCYLRCANRLTVYPPFTFDNYGFRVTAS